MLTLALVGRPNVGKSTLFNRLTSTRHAIVDDQPGVTRDRRYGTGNIGPMDFRVVDTAGMEGGKDTGELQSRMLDMTRDGIEEADIAIMMIDGLAGVTPEDSYFARWLRKTGKPMILAVNKAESKRAHPSLADAWELGLGEPVPISAEHGEGMADLFDALTTICQTHELDQYGENEPEEDANTPLQLAIIGRPNAGKSTLINALLGQERVLTGPEAGVTRDSIAIDWHWGDRPVKLVDTAGLRKQAKRNEKLERLSAVDSMRAIQYAHVCVLLLDAACPLDKQDLILADHIVEEGRGLVIAVNKWDEVDRPEAWMAALDKIVEKRLAMVKGVVVLPISAKKKTGFKDLMQAVFEVYELWNVRIPTGQLNRWLDGMMIDHPPPLTKSKRPIRLKYMTQIKSRPPTFALFATRKDKLPESYRRYLIGGIRKAFDLPAIPIRLTMRSGENPYAHKAKKR